MSRYRSSCVMAAFVLAVTASAAHADVFNMGEGLTSLEFVTVGNPGNAGHARHGERCTARWTTPTRSASTRSLPAQYASSLTPWRRPTPTGCTTQTCGRSDWGCKIQRSGSSGSYTYSVAADWANRPVNYVSWGDAARFANWLHNGQPTGAKAWHHRGRRATTSTVR